MSLDMRLGQAGNTYHQGAVGTAMVLVCDPGILPQKRIRRGRGFWVPCVSALPLQPHFPCQNYFSSRSCRRWNVNEERSLILFYLLFPSGELPV